MSVWDAAAVPGTGGVSTSSTSPTGAAVRRDAPALVLADRVLSHGELDDLVAARARELGDVRRLVLLECTNEVETVVSYLAALRGGHPVLLVPAETDTGRLLAEYRPDVVAHADGTLTERHPGTAHDLHPDLAVLLGTSGSTGSPKLVRLSRHNLRSNAAAIAGYLDLGPHSRAATSLPLHYCYGLSVLNSHLLVGGSVWLTDASVIDPGFWAAFAAAGATSLAGVPYTYELLERSGTDWLDTPGLRQLTQAGGRMPPERVRRIARAAQQRGIDLFVMYGQTEATARMAYLPPHLATDRPGCVGIPIEGGDLRVDPSAGSGHGDGELVYTGPNVMMGYAHSYADLARGPELTELRTGDLAVQHDDGLFEIVGRCNRIAKLFGTRIDLDLAEQLLAGHGVDARVLSTGDRLDVVVVEEGVGSPSTAEVAALVVAEHCLPAHAVRVHTLAPVPRTTSGKTDYAALSRLLAELPAPAEEPADVRTAFAGVFGTVRPDDTFTTLGGDSLSYVELYVRLERVLGDVPADWPRRTVADLAALRPRRRRRVALLETPLVLRAVAIVLIVLGHTDIVNLLGGAHVLLVVLGYNVARFALHRPRRERARALLGVVRDIAVPCTLWVLGAIVVAGAYSWSTAFYLTGWLHPDHWSNDWRLWFLDCAIWSLVVILVLTRLGPVDRALRRSPHLVAWSCLVGALALRYATPDVGVLTKYSFTDTLWLVMLGWVAATVPDRRRRLLVSAALPVLLIDFFPGDVERSAIFLGGVLLLLWVPRLPVPRVAERGVALLASASLFIYLTHWQVYRPLKYHTEWGAFVASMALGIAVYAAWTPTRRLVAARFRRA